MQGHELGIALHRAHRTQQLQQGAQHVLGQVTHGLPGHVCQAKVFNNEQASLLLLVL